MTTLPLRMHEPRSRQTRAVPRIEPLEGRRLLTTIVALTEANQLLRVDSSNPSAIRASFPVTGLVGGAGEQLVGIDFRPSTGQLYALSNEGGTGRLYTISQVTGAASLVATLAADPASSFTGLAGTHFGIDFNPVVDRLRVVSDADQNLRINPATGLVTSDSALAFAAADANVGVNPIVVDIAYNNNVAGASSTTLFGLEGLDPDLHATKTLPDGTVVPAIALVRQGDPGGAPLSPNSGLLTTLGPFGRDGVVIKGFDIAANGLAYVAAELHFPTQTATALVLINLASGADQALGRIGDGTVLLRDIAVAPSVQFTDGLFSVFEEGGTVMVTVMRSDDGNTPISVDFATVQGSARAGADFSSVSGRLDFAAGQMTKTIVIPILNDTTAEPDEFFRVVLRNPLGGTVLGVPSVARVRINANDRRDRVGPSILSVLETGPSRAITGFNARFNEDMDPTRAENLRNYTLIGIGRRGGQTRIPLGSATYDETGRHVTVETVQPFMQTQFRELQFRFKGDRARGLIDRSGNGLRAPRVFRFAVFSGRTVTFTDVDGDRATLRIANGGRLDGIRPLLGPRSQRTQFWILDPIALKSTLSGTVRRNRLGGNGIVVIAEIIGLDKKEFTPLLSNRSFRVNTLTFSSNATGIG